MTKKNYVKMSDIARKAGVSIATVSRVINSPELVAPATIEKVMNVIDENNYTINHPIKKAASNLGKSIAIFVYNLDSQFYLDIINHLNTLAFEHGYSLIICNTGDSPEKEEKYFEYCRNIQTSGIIFTTARTRETIGSRFKDYSPPMVLLDRDRFSNKPVYMLGSDHKKGMTLLMDYLYKLNHRKIGIIHAPQDIRPGRERLESFLNAAENLGLEIPPHYIKEGDFTVQSGITGFDYFYSMSDAPTAIVAANDMCARGIIMRANSLGVKIPDAFSVCGYDGSNRQSFYPEITSVIQDSARLSTEMFNLIINSKSDPPPKVVTVDVELSTGVTCHII
ncbi:MAG: LacI family DNA-binding transcriptional regulator [Fastidiosipilaceae bacterium]|jgi:DNA-binding LacI/PurR family transcriptional regulator